MPRSVSNICREDGDRGFLFPLGGDFEADLPWIVRAPIYLSGLAWCFLGVSVLADAFMNSIEAITAKKRRVWNKEKNRYQTVQVWNDTVSNLTLMALGSSAPEIMLNVLELYTEEMHAGALGPGTIVGSAAFNLFIIAAVCVMAIPSPGVRFIKDLQVYCVTATFSVLAYVWLIFILVINTQDIVDTWEAVVTLCGFPALIILAYLADIGFFRKKKADDQPSEPKVAAAEMTEEEIAEMVAKIRMVYGSEASEDWVADLIARQTVVRPTIATYRVARHADHHAPVFSKRRTQSQQLRGLSTDDNLLAMRSHQSIQSHLLLPNVTIVEFTADKYMVVESSGQVAIQVRRRGNRSSTTRVKYRTRQETATAGEDYVPKRGVLIFNPGEYMKEINVTILDDDVVEDLEYFLVELYEVESEDTRSEIGAKSVTQVRIIDDDHPGRLGFEKEEIVVEEQVDDIEIYVPVNRKLGSAGEISFHVSTEDATATSPIDYDELDETVTMINGQSVVDIPIRIKSRGRYESRDYFRVVLRDPTGGARFLFDADGNPECCICTIVIKAHPDAKSRVDRVKGYLVSSWHEAQLGSASWGQQLRDSLYVGGSAEEQSEAGCMDWVMHIIALPWTVLAGAMPPVKFYNGWALFHAALLGIALVTALISDLAHLVGCVLEMDAQVTAITIVALGTSLPDTFASKTAAIQDIHADASIGNITGSNSVNVFLGLGLPWTIASVYWKFVGATSEWSARYPRHLVHANPDGAFIVEAGNLTFSVSVFAGCAASCIMALHARRVLFGGELGGPLLPKVITAVFLLGLWVAYVAASWGYISYTQD
mmetsp:Transcript_11809/g.26787  ORF Transcript_11809/g.26787 Transcript_11809/m.26787 type:complete len:824 (+) Transcript_11809:68-2539(+)